MSQRLGRPNVLGGPLPGNPLWMRVTRRDNDVTGGEALNSFGGVIVLLTVVVSALVLLRTLWPGQGILYPALGLAAALPAVPLGARLGQTTFFRSYGGIALGTVFGTVCGTFVVTDFLAFRSRYTMSPDARNLITGACVLQGGVIGALPGMRNRPALWVNALALSATTYIGARLWLEDFPSVIGVVAFAIGAIAGALLSIRPKLWVVTAVVTGAIVGLGLGSLLIVIPSVQSLGRGAAIATFSAVGAVGGGLIALNLSRRRGEDGQENAVSERKMQWGS